MTHLRKTLRAWCINKVKSDDQTLHRSWFYIGNNPKVEPAQYTVNGHLIRTVSAPSKDPNEPTCWAMEIVHTDAVESARRWSAEATLRKNEDGVVRFTTVLKHWMIPNYIGKYPEPPSPSVPLYVRSFLNDNALLCKKGDATLHSGPVKVTNDNARFISDQLGSEERQLPFVFIAYHEASKGVLIDPERATTSLIGNANVFVLGSKNAVDEMNYYLGDKFRCESGAIRVYLPQFDKSNPSNARLHRYLTAGDIGKHGEAEIMRFLTNGLSQNGATFRHGDLTSFIDIFGERRRYAIKKLSSEAQGKTQEATMVWEENEKLSSQASEWESLALQCESENKQLHKENNALKYRIEEAERVRHRIEDMKSQLDGVQGLAALPTNLGEVLDCLSKVFPKRIECLEAAKSAAHEYSKEHDGYWTKQEQMAIAWEMVFDVATRLYDLVFPREEREGMNLEHEFDTQSRFALALNEGSETRKDAKLMSIRKIEYKGSELDITPHIKYGTKKPKILRLHFAIDRKSHRLVIGHFGDHLDNYSTRKL